METFFDFAPLLAIPAVTKIIDAYRQFVTNRDGAAAARTVGAWAVGTAIVGLVLQSNAVDLPAMNWADIILVGVGLGSSASVVHDFSTRNDGQLLEVTGTVDEIELPSGI